MGTCENAANALSALAFTAKARQDYRPKNAKVPVFQGISAYVSRDGFARDCFHHHQLPVKSHRSEQWPPPGGFVVSEHSTPPVSGWPWAGRDPRTRRAPLEHEARGCTPQLALFKAGHRARTRDAQPLPGGSRRAPSLALIGFIHDLSQGFRAPLIAVACSLLIGAMLMVVFGRLVRTRGLAGRRPGVTMIPCLAPDPAAFLIGASFRAELWLGGRPLRPSTASAWPPPRPEGD